MGFCVDLVGPIVS